MIGLVKKVEMEEGADLERNKGRERDYRESEGESWH